MTSSFKGLGIYLEKYGIHSQSELAEKTWKKYEAGSIGSMRCYINQVVNGKRPYSEKLQTLLKELTNNDPELIKYLEIKKKDNQEIEGQLYKTYIKYEEKIQEKVKENEEIFLSQSNEQRITTLAKLEKLVQELEVMFIPSTPTLLTTNPHSLPPHPQ